MEEDARQILGFYNDTYGSSSASAPPTSRPIPDPIEWIGYQLISFDGQYGLFDDDYDNSLASADLVIDGGSDDFVATYSDGSQHYFNVDGLLERIVDRNGRTVSLDWAIDTSKPAGLSIYSLAKIRAPSDGLAVAGGTAQRDIAVSGWAPGPSPSAKSWVQRRAIQAARRSSRSPTRT